MGVQLSVYGICKRWRTAKVESYVEYFVTGYEVVKHSDEEAMRLGFPDIVDDGEYLVLHLENGETVRYCNTRMDLYRVS